MSPGAELQTGDGVAGERRPLCASGRLLARQTSIAAIGPARRAGRRSAWWPCPAAQADDLIQLNGDLPVTLSGSVSYGLLYLDGTVRLAGDTAITATDVFIGPDAQLQTCFDPPNGNDCTNGRSLSITASGGVAISPAIDLRGGIGANRPGGSLVDPRGARRARRRRRDRPERPRPPAAISIDSSGLVVDAEPARARRRHRRARRRRRLDRRRRLERERTTRPAVKRRAASTSPRAQRRRERARRDRERGPGHGAARARSRAATAAR